MRGAIRLLGFTRRSFLQTQSCLALFWKTFCLRREMKHLKEIFLCNMLSKWEKKNICFIDPGKYMELDAIMKKYKENLIK